MRKFLSAGLCLAAGLSGLNTVARLQAEDASTPANMSRHLRQMVEWYQTEGSTQPAGTGRRQMLTRSLPNLNRRAQVDATGSRVVVDFQLDGTAPLANVQTSLEKMGIEVFARDDRGGAGSVLSARLPLARAVEAAKLPGVQSIKLVRKPQLHVGKATTQGAAVIKANLVNSAGYTGKGITVGVLSDSYNTVTPDAQTDIASGDLPGPGNPLGHNTPVNVLAEGTDKNFDTDEGRAMLQIVHDLAPDAALAFAEVGATPESFAANIRALRTRANCDVIVDDVSFIDEPFFSDGVVAQAIDDVVNSSTLAGKKVIYYTAVGNSGNGVYIGDFDEVPDATARAGLGNNNLQLDQVPAELTAGGFHNYNPKKQKAPIIVQRVTVRGSGMPVTDGSDVVELDFSWDDPYAAKLITTDYNLLVFDADGNYKARISGTDDNFSTGEPFEFADLNQAADGSDATYQIVITRTSQGAHTATHLRTIASTESSLYQTDNFTLSSTPSIYGHEASPNADGVAAYDYTKLGEPEDFSSVGPMTVYFDRAGNRLTTPDVRNQPTIAAPDGVDTTFFPQGSDQDSDNDGFPNFFGTSAAAPHAAGAAALLLQAGGGPNSLSAVQMRALLQSTTVKHDLDPFFSSAVATSKDGQSTVTVTANGNSSDNSAFDTKFFQVGFDGSANTQLRRIVINLSPAGLEFDTSTGSGFPFTISRRGTTADKTGVKATFNGPSGHPDSMRLKFAPGTFLPGDLLSFGVDRDESDVHSGGNSADALTLAGLSIRTTTNGVTSKGQGLFANKIGAGNTIVDGAGLINVEAALQKLLGN